MRFFEKSFGVRPEWIGSAPGRVNVIGDHVDYQGGFVLPVATDQRTRVAGRATGADVIRVASADFSGDGTIEIPLDREITKGVPHWANYVRGVVASYGGEIERGFDLAIESEVPVGAGLSSSAALEVAVACTIEGITGKTVFPEERALRCQRAEHGFTGVPCGIMDQFTACFAEAGAALLIDCAALEMRSISLPVGVVLLVADSGVRHELSASEYGLRRRDCEQAARVLGVKTLRDASLDRVKAASAELGLILYQRARHVVGEIARVQECAAAFRANDLEMAGRLMGLSHQSLREDFDVSCEELDILVALGERIGVRGGVFGTRMTGGGFGGCTVSLVDERRAPQVMESLRQGYLEAVGKEARVFFVRPGDGAEVRRFT